MGSGRPELRDAVATAAAIAQGELTKVEAVEAAIRRYQARGELGAVFTETFDRARRHAPEADGLLAGVPTFIKDLAHLAGVRTTWGSEAGGVYRPKDSDAITRTIEDLGLVVLGKSATPELGLTGTTEPLRFGPCRNPWNSGHSAGGSSGGAAALVAAGVVPIAHASDGAGSIRLPAACCGLVGLKPSRGRIDLAHSNLLPVNIGVNGVVTRTVRDTIAFYRGYEQLRPPRALPSMIPEPGPSRSQPLRVGFFTAAPSGTQVDPEVKAATEKAAAAVEALGHHVEPIAPPFSRRVHEDFYRYWYFVAWAQTTFGKILLHGKWDNDELEPFTRGLRKGFSSRKLTALQAVHRLRGFERSYAEAFQGHDVLLSPVATTPPPPIGYLSTAEPFATAMDRIQGYVGFTFFQNLAGAPGLALPFGQSQDGLPIGIHLAAARGQDATLLALATAFEEANPWPLVPPSQGQTPS